MGFMSLAGNPEPLRRPEVEGAPPGPHIGASAARITTFAARPAGNARFLPVVAGRECGCGRRAVCGRIDAPRAAMSELGMKMIRTVCVYCGSAPGADPAFAEAARKFGKILAERRVGLVYGGGSLGLMGALAGSVLDHGGRVTGVIPEFLTDREHVMA